MTAITKPTRPGDCGEWPAARYVKSPTWGNRFTDNGLRVHFCTFSGGSLQIGLISKNGASMLNQKHYVGCVVARGCSVSETISSELLTKREREILRLLGLGKTSKEISALLAISITTIASHRRSICRKLAVHSTAELVRYAVVLNAWH